LQIYYYVIIKIMKNKWIFIGIGTLLIIVVGIIIFIHFTAPEVLTKTPLELITGRDIQNGAKDTIPTPTRTDNFIVPDEVWENAFLLSRVDGTEARGVVGFSDVPVGTKLYAPIDGWSVSAHGIEMGENWYSLIILSSPSFPEREVWLIASLIEVINHSPKKGEFFATVREVIPLPDKYNQIATLAVSVDDIWARSSNREIIDPKTYLRNFFEKTN